MKLNLGCGKQVIDGFTGIDCCGYPDILHDLNKGIPFCNNTVSHILLDNSLEHFYNPFFIIGECYRVLKRNGIIEIIIPNTQWFPFLILSWLTDLHRFWNWWMGRKKDRGLHYSLWTPYTLELLLGINNFSIIKRKGCHLSKEYYIKAIK